MIVEYHRPTSEAEALELLRRSTPKTVPLGGGTVLSNTKDDIAVVDLQNLGWNKIEKVEGQVLAGSCTTLEDLLVYFGSDSAMGMAIAIDAAKNIRDMATLGGSIAVNDGRSALLTVLLAANISVELLPGKQVISLSKWLSERTANGSSYLISKVLFLKNLKIQFESVGRSPVDKPVICCAVTISGEGRMRISFGGFGSQPVLAYEGDRNGDYMSSIDLALSHAGDEWASSEYRLEAGPLLAKRLIANLA